MRTLTFACANCGITAQHTTNMVGAYNVGYAMADTGFTAIFSSMCDKSIWLCPHCWKTAVALARQLEAIIGNTDVTLSTILRTTV